MPCFKVAIFDRWILLADRRGLGHFLRSNHTSAAEVATRSRRTSRSTTNDRVLTAEQMHTAAQRHDHLQDMEHKRVIDSFVVNRTRPLASFSTLVLHRITCLK